MLARRSAFALACFLIGFASCSGDDESEPGGSGGNPHSDGGNSSGAVAPEELDAYCQTLAAFVCDRCFEGDLTCATDLDATCGKNAMARDPNGYTKAKGQACLDALATIDCENAPRDCNGNLAVEACNTYLDGQTSGVDAACS